MSALVEFVKFKYLVWLNIGIKRAGLAQQLMLLSKKILTKKVESILKVASNGLDLTSNCRKNLSRFIDIAKRLGNLT